MLKQNDEITPVVLLGAGGHSRVIIDIIQKYYIDMEIIGILDRDPIKKGVLVDGVEVIGSDDRLMELKNHGVQAAFISIGILHNFKPRMELFHRLEQMGFKIPNIIHGKSVISRNVTMGHGNAVMALAVINAGSRIGDNCIINTGSIVEHDSIICDNVHIAPGAIICGGVRIGSNSLIGAGSTVIQGINIGENVIVGAGSVVTKDTPSSSRVVGVPSRFI